MCKLIWKVLRRRGPFSEKGLDLAGNEIECRATNTYYGVLYPPSGNRNDCHISLRLSIFTAKHHTVQDWDGHHEQYCFQACTPGTTLADPPYDVLDTASGLEPTIFGGRKRPLTVNCDWLRTWIRICAERHGARCRPSLGSGQGDVPKSRTKLIRFVDTHNNAITSIQDVWIETLEYAALSYVWGSNQKITLTGQNATQLTEFESIVEGVASLTIVDAMELCRRIGVRYLWVDALCIIQDDDNDKAIQLQAMSNIYRCASFTIVAASGEDAGAGLPGLRPGTRSFEQEEVLVAQATESNPALSLMTTCNPKLTANVHYLEDTKWNTRGWTFQEKYLSNRCLVFTEEQVYFSCNEVVFCEESYLEHGPPYLYPFEPTGSELSLYIEQQHGEPDDASERFWVRYRTIVDRFTRRHLGYQGDVYDAFEGLEKALFDMSGERFLWGLPCGRLDAALAWDTFDGQSRRHALSTLPMTDLNRKVAFPSWSWMGWIGEAHVSVTDERVESGETPSVDIFCHTKHVGRVVIRRIDHQQSGSDKVVVQLDDIQKAAPSLTEATLLDIPDNHVLFFWADNATFKVERELERKPSVSGESCRILDSNNKSVGKTSPMLAKHYDQTGCDSGEREFVAISRRQLLDCEAVITAIQVDRQHGIAYRVNIGEISESAWNDAGPQCLLLVLG
ncbi:hypothetical protein Daus18300_009563 [Diaporthe australafricana]|uniref:Heterokaryon incompatibility domain-containing protein n=1 Tax=Diaporthe australafricana TaxID=127596 RepID=A0ABR3WDU7_9PEZI